MGSADNLSWGLEIRYFINHPIATTVVSGLRKPNPKHERAIGVNASHRVFFLVGSTRDEKGGDLRGGVAVSRFKTSR